jgi:hypothetical protein
MYRVSLLALILTLFPNHQLSAQEPSAEQHEHGTMDMSHADHGTQMERGASGTAWLPDETPMYALHSQRGAWLLMAHENAFMQFLHESGARGDDQFGSINWFMGMALHNLGRGRLMLRGMVSAEAWTIGGCGYPDLLATGEQCNGAQIHDRQHPHDFLMEISGQYDAALSDSIRWQVYGGPAARSRRSGQSAFRIASRHCRTRSRRSRTTGSIRRTSPMG